MPLGAFRLNTLAKTSAVVTDFTEAIRTPIPTEAYSDTALSTTTSKFGNTSVAVETLGDDLEIKSFDLINRIDEGDFTFEAWVYFTNAGGQTGTVFGSAQTSTGGNGWILRQRGDASVATDKNFQFQHYGYGVNIRGTSYFGSGIANNTWYHVAVVREGTTISLYFDGDREATTTQATNSVADASTYHGGIGANGYYSSWAPGTTDTDDPGYVSEMRFSTTARYSGTTYTVPTSKFTNDADTMALFHFDGTNGQTTIVDDTGDRARLGIQAVGNAQISSTQSKFGGTSINLDGTGDYLVVEDNAEWDDHGTGGEWTIEGWIRVDDITTRNQLMVYRNASNVNEGWGLEVRANEGNGTLIYFHSAKSGQPFSVGAISANTWHYIAAVGNGLTVDLYVDGSRVSTGTLSGYNTNSSTPGLYIGSGQYGTLGDFGGYIEGFRYSNVARYSGTTMTVPTEPLVSDADTLFLLQGTGTPTSQVMLDDNSSARAPMAIRPIGNTNISTTQSKFGGTSAYLDGTGDYFLITDEGNKFDFGTGDFTIEWFQYLTSLDRFAIDFRAGSSATTKILLYSYPTDGGADDLYFYTTTNRIEAYNCLSANTWQHIVAQRESGTTRLFVDGAQVGSDYADTNNYAHTEMRIWHNSIGAENYTPPGYIDEFRVSSVARYTGTSYTVPTAPFKNDSNTIMLMHADGDSGQTDFLDDNSALLQ